MKIYESFESIEKQRLKRKNNSLNMGLKSSGGLYCIWLNDPKILEKEYPVIIQGPSISLKTIEDSGMDPENESMFRKVKYGDKYRYYVVHKTSFDLSISQKDSFIPVYIGKTTNMSSRIRQHIMPTIKCRSEYLRFKKNSKDNKPYQFKYNNTQKADYIIKRNTSSQFRAGLEYIFRFEGDSYAYNYIWEKVYVSLIYEEDFKSRFYSENSLIGQHTPMFNIDGER